MSRGRIVAKVVLLFALPVGFIMFLVNGYLLPGMDIDPESRDTLTIVVNCVGIAVSSTGCALWANRMANPGQNEAPGESEES